MSDAKSERPGDCSRLDFLRTAGLASATLGVASLAAPSVSAADAKGRYIVVITHGSDDPNRAILGLLMALRVAEKGLGELHVWTTIHGAELANRAKAEKIVSPIFKKFGNGLELVLKLKEKGATFRVCPPCAEAMGATGAEKMDFFELKGADWLMQNLAGAQVAWT